MGYVFTSGYRRKDVIEQVTRPWTDEHGVLHRPLKHCTRGNTLWMVYQVGDEEPFIVCTLLRPGRGGTRGSEWGYKHMTESMGPNYYSCPVGYLDLAPEPEHEETFGSSDNWRAKVRRAYALSLTRGRANKAIRAYNRDTGTKEKYLAALAEYQEKVNEYYGHAVQITVKER